MGEERDCGRTAAVAVLTVLVPIGVGLTLYWTVAASFPQITLGGWLLVCAYLFTVVAVPISVTPFLSRTIDLERYTFGRARRVTAFVWVVITTIAGLLAWPVIGPFIRPFFVGSARAL